MEEKDAKWVRMPHPADRAGEEFTQSIADHIQTVVEAHIARFIPPENVLRPRHGGGWSIGRSDASTDIGTFKKIEARQSIDHESFMNNDLQKLLTIVQGMSQELKEENEALVIETINAAAESAGNLVSAGSWPEAFLASLEQIKLTADRHGNVTMPQIVVHSDTREEMIAELEAQEPAYRERVEALLQRKADEARREELVRISNYEGVDAPE